MRARRSNGPFPSCTILGGAAVVVAVAAVQQLLLPLLFVAGDAPQDIKVVTPPDFPHLFSLDAMLENNFQLHLVSESVSDQNGYETIEEYLDLGEGKMTSIVSGSEGGRVVRYIDSRANVMYRYKPYSCEATKLDATFAPADQEGRRDLWSFVAEMPGGGGGDSLNKQQVHLYGVAALWLRAGAMPKTYELAQMAYSASKDIYSPAHSWTIRDEVNNELVHFYFIDNNYKLDNNGARPSSMYLEAIKFESLGDGGKSTRTINILSSEHYIASWARESLLQAPVGFGCSDADLTQRALNQYPALKDLYLGPLLAHSHRLDLEATASKFEFFEQLGPSGATSGYHKRVSTTVGIELAHTEVKDKLGAGSLQLLRRRDATNDTKSIANYQYNVRYDIDLRRGQCQMSSIQQQQQQPKPKQSDSPSRAEQFNIDFDNGLSLDMNLERMRELFLYLDGFAFIKRTTSTAKDTEYLYLEKRLFEDAPVRVVRTYSSQTSSGGQERRVQLESVTIWVLDAEQEHILESYHLNILDARSLESRSELAKLFDISEECYLNKPAADKAHAGGHRDDYAWLQLTYPVPGRLLRPLASRAAQLRELIYARFASAGHLSFFRAPRIELSFEDDEATSVVLVRVLVLDLPPLALMFHLLDNTALKVNKQLGDLDELAMDLEHCTDLCRLNQCRTMTYCGWFHHCRLTTEQISTKATTAVGGPAAGSDRLEDSVLCKTYTLPTSDGHSSSDISMQGVVNFDQLFETILQRLVSVLQHENYDPIALPKMPEELLGPLSESGLDQETYDQLQGKYLDEVMSYLEKDQHRLPMVTFSLTIDQTIVVLVPNRFELEQDPLLEFDSHDLAPTDSEQVAGFREAMNMYHFKTGLARFELDYQRQPRAASTAAATGSGEEAPGAGHPAATKATQGRKNWRLFNGLNYEQCALACVDTSSCQSFSYCHHIQECIITDVYEFGYSTDELVEIETDCTIVQRNYLSKFNRFEQVDKPQHYRRVASALNPSECAHSCVLDSEFNCLAFDYCPKMPAVSHPQQQQQQHAAGGGTCYYLEERRLYTGAIQQTAQQQQETVASGANYCDHYSRSYLADFHRIEYRQIEPSELAKLKTSLWDGHSVDQCADVCVNELADCTAFQFCFDPLAQGAKQSCVMIESRPQGAAADFRTVLNRTAASGGHGDTLVKAGKFVTPHQGCHVFALRRDSFKAAGIQSSQLALESATSDELEADEQRAKLEGADGASRGSLSVGGGFLLYLFVTLAFATLSCGLSLARERSAYLRQKIERAELVLRVR